MRKTCEACHVTNATNPVTDAAAPQVQDPGVLGNHPTGPGTPFDTTKFDSSCVVCHMATQAEANGDQNSMPVHVWRINTDPNYNTFPSLGQFYGGTCRFCCECALSAGCLRLRHLVGQLHRELRDLDSRGEEPECHCRD